MTAAKKPLKQMSESALRAHAKALEDCFERTKRDLRLAKKELRTAGLQLQAAQEHGAMLQEVFGTVKALAYQAREDPGVIAELVGVLEEWTPS